MSETFSNRFTIRSDSKGVLKTKKVSYFFQANGEGEKRQMHDHTYLDPPGHEFTWARTAHDVIFTVLQVRRSPICYLGADEYYASILF